MYYRLFDFLESMIPAAIVLLPIMFYYLHKRDILRAKKEILLKEIEKGSIVDPEMLAKSLANPSSEEMRLQNSLRDGIIFCIAGTVIAIATIVFYLYLNGIYAEHANDVYDLIPITLVVTLVLVAACIVLGVGIAFLVTHFNMKKRISRKA